MPPPSPAPPQSDAAVAKAVEVAKNALTRKAHSRHSAFISGELAKGRALNEGLKSAVDDAKLSASQGAGGMAADAGDSDGGSGGEQDASTLIGSLIADLHTAAQELAVSAHEKVVGAGKKAVDSIAGMERKAAA